MIWDKSGNRAFNKPWKSKNRATLIVLFIVVLLFYGLAVVRLQTSLAL